MPLPLIPIILGGASLAAAALGIKKGVDAKSDFDSAKSWNKKAQSLYDEASNELKSAHDDAQEAIKLLGESKFEIYEDSIIPFVEIFSKIKNIDFKDSRLLEAANLPQITNAELNEIKQAALEMKEVVGGGIAALGSGGLAGLAAYGSVGLLGTASTGTAIGTLSGVAATNATLAWLGGGSLAAGGLGMAGGTVVLGGIVAGPVLAVGGMMLASKAEAAKHDAYANYDKAQLAAEQMKTATVATNGIHKRFNEINEVLNALNDRFVPLLNSLEELVASNDNYSTYTEIDKKGVFIVASTAKTIKSIMEAPLIDESGALTPDSHKALEFAEERLSSL
ncbi:hypothetical protein HW932_13950 [Allochromatium humboldtianum]|uniref:Uncharacterized protein n=1 Tax=Allochromatium humboldtianum TaxID=504901 RepID=A0A850R8Z4_9GAMM|nr:hypothetical protein [Allochromatium humboldtianum]NVZ10364.1 hypothetical protein [Allochromatium humboldtianum]